MIETADAKDEKIRQLEIENRAYRRAALAAAELMTFLWKDEMRFVVKTDFDKGVVDLKKLLEAAFKTSGGITTAGE